MTKEELINLAKTSTDIEQLLTLSFGDIDIRLAILQNPHCTNDLLLSIIDNMTDDEITNNMDFLTSFRYTTTPKKIINNPNCPTSLLLQDFISYSGSMDYHPFWEKYIWNKSSERNNLKLSDKDIDNFLNSGRWLNIAECIAEIDNKLTLSQRIKILDFIYLNNKNEYQELLKDFFYYSHSYDLKTIALHIKDHLSLDHYTTKYLIANKLISSEDLEKYIDTLPIYKSGYYDAVQFLTEAKNIPVKIVKKVLLSGEKIEQNRIVDIIENDDQYIVDLLSDDKIISLLDEKNLFELVSKYYNVLGVGTISNIINNINDDNTIEKYLEMLKRKKWDKFNDVVLNVFKYSINNNKYCCIYNYAEVYFSLWQFDKDTLIKIFKLFSKDLYFKTLENYYFNYDVLSIILKDSEHVNALNNFSWGNKDTRAKFTNKVSADEIIKLIPICVDKKFVNNLLQMLNDIDSDKFVDTFVDYITSHELNDFKISNLENDYKLTDEQIEKLQNSTVSTELCKKVILGAANNTQVQVNSIKRSIKDTDSRELAEMLKSPSCPTETTEEVLSYYKSNSKSNSLSARDKINTSVLEAIFNNPINSDKIIETAFKLYIYYYSSYSMGSYSKLILNHSRFNQEMYINLTKYLIKNKLGSFLLPFISYKYCTKDLYVAAVCTNTFKLYDTGFDRFEFTEEDLKAMTKANKDAIGIAIRSKNCPKSILIKAIKENKDTAAVNHANMDSKTLDKIVSICDPTYYSTLLCDKLSVKSILTIIKNGKDFTNYQISEIVNILKQKDFESDEVQELLNMDTDLSKKIILALPNINQSYLSNLFE